MFEYDECTKRAAEKLDEYDFTEILNLCYDNNLKSPWEIADKIMEKYEELGVLGGAFDYLSVDEFMKYLSERYPVRFEEVIAYRMQYK